MIKIIKVASALTITMLISSNAIHAQETPKIIKDKKLDTLLELKQTLETNNNLYNGYTIQLHNGDLERAKKRKSEYEETKSVWPAFIEYENPNFKLWVGNFETRLEADQVLMKLREKFPSAFILKPDRK